MTSCKPSVRRTLARLGASAVALAAATGAAGVAHADALGSPSMTAPLSANPNPVSFDGGPLGKIYVSGQLTGLGLVQTHTAPFPGSGNAESLLDISNGQVEVQTTSGPIQFFLEAGAYTFPALGTSYIKPGKNLDLTFGALPVAYAKFVATPEISVQVGELPTLIGAEYAFTFQNMNIERGLLWNQENIVNKGVQANYAKGPLTVSVSVNDGYDSDHYNWLTGLASYAIDGANTVVVDGGFNFASTFTNKFRAPNAQNNSGILDLSYTWSKGPWLINPYFQYTDVSADANIGIIKGASTYGGAVLAKYSFTPTLSLAGRVEYISSSSDKCGGVNEAFCYQTNLLYGPGSNAFSVTLTPTYQKGVLFARGEVSYTKADSITPGFAFGKNYQADDQFRGLVEVGFLF